MLSPPPPHPLPQGFSPGRSTVVLGRRRLLLNELYMGDKHKHLYQSHVAHIVFWIVCRLVLSAWKMKFRQLCLPTHSRREAVKELFVRHDFPRRGCYRCRAHRLSGHKGALKSFVLDIDLCQCTYSCARLEMYVYGQGSPTSVTSSLRIVGGITGCCFVESLPFTVSFVFEDFTQNVNFLHLVSFHH